MTPQEIIDSLPEGNRKRACQIIEDLYDAGMFADFWFHISKGQTKEATDLLFVMFTYPDADDMTPTGKVLSDMIWEG